MGYALNILGGLGVFLFGLRVMSGGLQKMAGSRLRAILGGLTRNRFAGILSGFLITCAVQSSSATTVLVVSFANAGLLTLMQSIGLVMGANIGTTLTAWLVALLGFKIKISSFALPIIGVGFPLSLINSRRARHISEIMIGFGLLFLGLKFLKDGVPDLKGHPQVFDMLTSLSNYGFGSVLLFILAGMAITVIVQSSSASTAIVLTMVAKEWIGLDLAAAMALGANIGTTITAQLATIGANRNAKRVAMFHTLFNIGGVLMILPIMSPMLSVVTAMIPGESANALVATSRVAAFHTAFNVLVTVALVAFVPQMERLVMRILPLRGDEAEGGHLKFLESGLVGTPELASLEVRRALQLMVQTCDDMFRKVSEVINNPGQKMGPTLDDVKRGEQQTDEMEEEIIEFCTELARSATSVDVGRDVAAYLEMANDIERIGDHCMNLALLAERRWDKGLEFTEGTQSQLAEMMEAVSLSLEHTAHALGTDKAMSLADAKLLEGKINKLRDRSRKSHARLMQDGEVSVRAGLIFLNMMTNMEKVGDYCWNVSHTLHYNVTGDAAA